MADAPTLSHTVSTSHVDLAALRAGVRGRVITRADDDYDRARAVMYGGVGKRPAAIVRVADSADITAVIGIARETGVELAIRSGGHSNAGHSTTDGGIVIDLRDLTALDIDVQGRTAWAETGLTAAEFTQATAAHGLAVGFGDTGSVGLGGITLGGGVGYLVRKHGLTIDSLLAAEIVTAAGELLHVDEASHPDLFWAIRGGGGNFGIATRFKFRLHPVGHVLGGMLILPATPDTVVGFIAESEAAPEELSAIANVMPCPPMPFVPEEHHGRVVILALVCWAGDLAAGERTLARLRALGEPLADMVGPISLPEMYGPEDPDYHPTAVSTTLFMDGLGLPEAKAILEHLAASDASMRVAQLRVLGGAYTRIPNDATAYAHRDRRIMVNVAAFYTGEDDRPIREAWVSTLGAELSRGDAAGYVNFLTDEGAERVRAAYPAATWERLAKIKAQYDPTNLFRLNQNIPPAG